MSWNLVSQTVAKTASESMYNTDDSKVKSKLVDSYAWDTTCKWLKNRNVSYTEYVEMIVLLHQQNPDDTIKIDLALGELDETSAELKATHQEIKDYVLKELVHI